MLDGPPTDVAILSEGIAAGALDATALLLGAAIGLPATFA